MHRTQIYLQDALHSQLRARASSLGVSMSEFIRRTLEKGLQQNPLSNAEAFFEQLAPLDSFIGVDADRYVRDLRNKSRLLRAAEPE